MHPALEVKMTFGMGRCVRRSQAPATQIGLLQEQPFSSNPFTPEIVLNFLTRQLSLLQSMHYVSR